MSEEKNSKTQEFRQKVAEKFIEALQLDPLIWRKGWTTVNTLPVNAVTSKKYRGINSLSLYLTSLELNYTDPRFATFKQIQDKGWTFNDAKGTGLRIEYWFPYDRTNKKYCTWAEYKDWLKQAVSEQELVLLPKYYTVFNAKYIDGIPTLEKPLVNEDIILSELIPKICKNMGIKILDDGGNAAYYSIRDDNIHLPKAERFKGQEEYDATCTHELSHATGAKHRLHRFEKGLLSEQRVMEELVAEISSSFLSIHFQQAAAPVELSGEEMQNHIAYVQDWIAEIKDKPEYLMKAIKDAESAASYLELQAEIISEKEYDHIHGLSEEINIEKPTPEKKLLETVLEQMKNELTEEAALKFINQMAWELKEPVFDEFHNVICSQLALQPSIAPEV